MKLHEHLRQFAENERWACLQVWQIYHNIVQSMNKILTEAVNMKLNY